MGVCGGVEKGLLAVSEKMGDDLSGKLGAAVFPLFSKSVPLKTTATF